MKQKIKITDWDQLPIVMRLEDIMVVMQIGRDLALAIMHSAGFPSFQEGRKYFVYRENFKKWVATR